MQRHLRVSRTARVSLGIAALLIGLTVAAFIALWPAAAPGPLFLAEGHRDGVATAASRTDSAANQLAALRDSGRLADFVVAAIAAPLEPETALLKCEALLASGVPAEAEALCAR